MPIKDGVLFEFDHEIATTRKLLERLPENEEGLAWKPHAKSMSFGGIGTHLANIPTWAVWIFDHPFFDLAERPHVDEQHSRAAILKQFDDSASAARKALEKSDAEYAGMWTLKRGGQDMFSMPRMAVLRTFVISHLIHHRGQLSVYLRLRDIPVPAIYGPSADEGQ